VLGDRNPGPRNDKGRGRGNVESALLIAAGSASIEQVLELTRTRYALSRITRAAPVISSTLSPFMRKAVRKAATWSGVASPVMI
jgi:hypothetical protein